MMYLKPRRPTFTKVGLRDELAWGRKCIVPLKNAHGHLQNMQDFHMLDEHNLNGPQSVTFWKMVHFKKAGREVANPWYPAAKLPIEPLHEHSERKRTSTFLFWQGKEKELELHAKKEEDKKRRDAARRERLAAAAAGLAPPPRRRPAGSKTTRSKRKGSKASASQAKHVGEVRLATEDAQKETDENDMEASLFGSESEGSSFVSESDGDNIFCRC